MRTTIRLAVRCRAPYVLSDAQCGVNASDEVLSDET
jgi:hypothetical protein